MKVSFNPIEVEENYNLIIDLIIQFLVVDKFPFEIEEAGWGEFQIQIKIYFHDAPDRPITVFHNLRLYEAGEDLEAQIKNNCPHVTSEHFEEIVSLDW